MAVQIGPVPSTDEKSHVRQNTAIQQLFKAVGQFSIGRVSKTGNYTVQNTDKNSKLGLNGGFFTLTFGNPSSYDSDFSITIVNEDTTSAKVVVLPNYADGTTYTFFVWPLQNYLVFSENAKWFLFGGKQRWDLQPLQAITFYADPAGSDSNDGLDPTRACASVLTLWNRIRDETWNGDTDITIQMKQGATFGSLGELDGDSAGNFGRLIEITGDVTLVNPAIVSVGASSIGLKLRDGAWASVSGIRWVATGSASVGVTLEQASLADLHSNDYGSFAGGTHVSASDFSLCNLTGTNKISGGAGTAWSINSMARLFVNGTFDGASAARAFSNFFLGVQALAYAEFDAAVFTNVASFTGQRYNLTLKSLATSGGVVLPGSIAGTADASSTYV